MAQKRTRQPKAAPQAEAETKTEATPVRRSPPPERRLPVLKVHPLGFDPAPVREEQT